MGLFSRSQKIGPLPPLANPYPSRFQQFRRRLNRYGAGGLVILLLVCSALFPNRRDELIRNSLDSLVTMADVARTPIDIAMDTFNDAKSISTLKNEVAGLQGTIRDLRGRLIHFDQLKYENNILKHYLHVPVRPNLAFFTAPVVVTPKGGIQHSLLIGVGSKDGARRGMGVIDHNGVVGRLTVVGGKTSRVRLLTDPQSRIPVYLPRLQVQAILAGNGTHLPSLVYVPEMEELKESDTIMTSGHGGIFPYGISIGRIKKIEGGIAYIHLNATPEKSHYLQVIEVQHSDPEFEESEGNG